MRFALVAAAVSIASCSKAKPAEFPPRHLSAADHDKEAAQHDEAARAAAQRTSHEQPLGTSELNEGTSCFDNRLAGVPYSGGQPLNVARPCWTSVVSKSRQREDEAEAHRQLAAQHRASAQRLLETEKAMCGGLGEAEISESPFWHREDVLSVQPYREDGQLRGAKVVFRAVKGLSALFLRRASKCHQARAAALGFRPTFMAYCPLSLPDVTVDVASHSDGFTVTLRAKRDETAAAVLARSRDLKRARTK